MLDNKLEPVVIALGYFDSVHRGHQKVIKTAVDNARLIGAKTVVFTFDGNLKGAITGGNDKAVFTAEERVGFIKDAGADEIYFAPVTEKFLAMDKTEFLDFINDKFNIKSYVSGGDYRFGKGGQGRVCDIVEYAKEKNQSVITVDTLILGEEKISTTAIKEYLSAGDIVTVNKLLGREYSVSGKVFEDRKVGRKIGFPTVNVKIDSQKHRLKDGVYSGGIVLDGKYYKTLINYGARPTYSLDEKLIEAHIVDYSGELYGKNITVTFNRFIRDIVKFTSEERLKEQLLADLKKVRENAYD